jgi:hypothetical protein
LRINASGTLKHGGGEFATTIFSNPFGVVSKVAVVKAASKRATPSS